jgi:hypothetical protein
MSGSQSNSDVGAFLDALELTREMKAMPSDDGAGAGAGGAASMGNRARVEQAQSRTSQQHHPTDPTASSPLVGTTKLCTNTAVHPPAFEEVLAARTVYQRQHQHDHQSKPASNAHSHTPCTHATESSPDTESTAVLQLREILAMKDKVIQRLQIKLAGTHARTHAAANQQHAADFDFDVDVIARTAGADARAHGKTKVALRDTLQQLSTITKQLTAEMQKHEQEQDRYQKTLASINESADDQVRKYAQLEARSKEFETEAIRTDRQCQEKEDELTKLHASIKELKAAHRRERQDWNLQLQQQRFYAQSL